MENANHNIASQGRIDDQVALAPSAAQPGQSPTIIDAEKYRNLFGIPGHRSPMPPLLDNSSANGKTEKKIDSNPNSNSSNNSWMNKVVWRCLRLLRLVPTDWIYPRPERSLYLALIDEERKARKRYHWVDFVIYLFLVLQLLIASILIILSAVAGDNHIAVAVLGAVIAFITGLLSLLKGQGLPIRLFNYAEELRKVRDEIDFVESGLRTNTREVKFADVESLWNMYEQARNSKSINHPDIWASTVTTPFPANRNPLVGNSAANPST